MGRLLDLSRRASRASEAVREYEINEKSEIRSEGPQSDPYSARLQKALAAICRPDYPGGLIPWLSEAYPLPYVELTEALPNELQKQWEVHAPIETFEKTLSLWLEAHRSAVDLHKSRPKPLPEWVAR